MAGVAGDTEGGRGLTPAERMLWARHAVECESTRRGMSASGRTPARRGQQRPGEEERKRDTASLSFQQQEVGWGGAVEGGRVVDGMVGWEGCWRWC